MYLFALFVCICCNLNCIDGLLKLLPSSDMKNASSEFSQFHSISVVLFMDIVN